MTMVMAERSIPAGRFKAECLALLDDVAQSNVEIVVTKRGRPVARVVPVEPAPSLRGSVAYRTDEAALLAPIEAGWDAAPGV